MSFALILVDALSAVYVSRATLPALCDLAEGGFAGPMANLYAYRGIEATLFTGQFPADHGVWGEFQPAVSKPEAWPDRVAWLAIKAGDFIPSDRLRLDVRYVVSRLGYKNQLPLTGNLIPAELRPRFTSSLERPIWEAGSLGETQTLFDELRAADLTFATVLHPVIQSDQHIEPYVRAYLARGHRPGFWYIKYSALDALGHRFGPSVTKLAPALQLLNMQLAALISTLKAAYPPGELDLAVIADHGMSDVQGRLDVRGLLKQVPGNFLYFLDSTTLRFWSEDSQTGARLQAWFADIPGLHILDQAARRALRIPEDSRTGDILIVLDEGQVIFPDFFHRSSLPRGMHGYAFIKTEAGLPFLALEQEAAACLPSHWPLTHADVWSVIRQRLGLVEQGHRGKG